MNLQIAFDDADAIGKDLRRAVQECRRRERFVVEAGMHRSSSCRRYASSAAHPRRSIEHSARGAHAVALLHDTDDNTVVRLGYFNDIHWPMQPGSMRIRCNYGDGCRMQISRSRRERRSVPLAVPYSPVPYKLRKHGRRGSLPLSSKGSACPSRNASDGNRTARDTCAARAHWSAWTDRYPSLNRWTMKSATIFLCVFRTLGERKSRRKMAPKVCRFDTWKKHSALISMCTSTARTLARKMPSGRPRWTIASMVSTMVALTLADLPRLGEVARVMDILDRDQAHEVGMAWS